MGVRDRGYGLWGLRVRGYGLRVRGYMGVRLRVRLEVMAYGISRVDLKSHWGIGVGFRV